MTEAGTEAAGKGRRQVVILGALSAMAEATARQCAERGDALLLVARNGDRLERLAEDLRIRGAASCTTFAMDLAEVDDTEAAFREITAAAGVTPIHSVFLFYGVLGDAREEERDIAAARKSMRINFTSAAEWCLAAAAQLETQRSGALVVAGSVAGDRGRQSNYIYGASKSGLATLVQGIAHRLAPSGARAHVVKLGFVDTPMTAHIEKKGFLWAKPDEIGRKMIAVADRGTAPVVYMPWFWRLIMFIIRNVPTPIFHKTKL